MVGGMNRTSPFAVIPIVAVAMCVAVACVGESGDGSTSAAPEAPAGVAPGVNRDTVASLEFAVFQTEVDSEEPRKVTYSLMISEDAPASVLSKTLHEALDSIGRADSTLVAARAVLYLARRAGAQQLRLRARIWGEWLTAEGWDDATTASLGAPHRTYTYNIDPGWAAPDTLVEGGTEP